MSSNKRTITPIPDIGIGPIQDEAGRWLLEAQGGETYDPFGTEEGLRGHQIVPPGNPDDEGTDRCGERTYRREEATAAFNRMNGHQVCGGDAGFLHPTGSLFDNFDGDDLE